MSVVVRLKCHSFGPLCAGCIASAVLFLLIACGGGGAGGGGSGGDGPANYLPAGITGNPPIYASVMTDVNGDGHVDLVLHRHGDASETMLLNDGTGHFVVLPNAFATPHYLGSDGDDVALVPLDANGDGAKDLLVITVDSRPGTFYQSSKLSLWINDGQGRFTDHGADLPNGGFYGGWAEWPLVADFDGDGHDDYMLNVGNCSPRCHGIINLNDGHGKFAAATDLRIDYGRGLGYESPPSSGLLVNGNSAYAYAIGDLDGDGKPDVLDIAEQTAFLNRTTTAGSPRFIVQPTGWIGGNSHVAILDYDGDGRPDLVSTLMISFQNNVTTPFHAFRHQPDGTFAPDDGVLPPGVGLEHGRQILVADFDGNGRPDIYVADHGFDQSPWPGQPNTLLLLQPNGTFIDGSARLSHKSTYTHGASFGDVDGDGLLDLFENNQDFNGLAGAAETDFLLFLNHGGAGFTGVR